MDNKIKIVLYVFIAVAISFVVNFSITIVNDKLFLESLQFEQASKQLEDGAVDLSKIVEGEAGLVELDVSWPWYSLVFYFALFTTYWFFFGTITNKILGNDSFETAMIVPIVTSALLFDLVLPLYLLAVYIGSKKGAVRHKGTLFNC